MVTNNCKNIEPIVAHCKADYRYIIYIYNSLVNKAIKSSVTMKEIIEATQHNGG